MNGPRLIRTKCFRHLKPFRCLHFTTMNLYITWCPCKRYSVDRATSHCLQVVLIIFRCCDIKHPNRRESINTALCHVKRIEARFNVMKYSGLTMKPYTMHRSPRPFRCIHKKSTVHFYNKVKRLSISRQLSFTDRYTIYHKIFPRAAHGFTIVPPFGISICIEQPHFVA